MSENQTIIAGILIAAAILLNGFWQKDHRYTLSAAGDSQTVWRLDTVTGQISMCGAMIGGNAFSKLDSDQTNAIVNLSKDTPPEQAKQFFDKQDRMNSLSQPRCTNWYSDAH